MNTANPKSGAKASPTARITAVVGSAVTLAFALCYLPGTWNFLLVSLCGFAAWAVIVHQLYTMLRENGPHMDFIAAHRDAENRHMPAVSSRDYLHMEAAENLLKHGHLVACKQQLDSVSGAFHLRADYHRMRFDVARREGRWQVALDAAQTFCRQAPEDPQSWCDQAIALQALGLPHRALDLLLGVIHEFPTEPLVHYQLACASCRSNRMDEALKWLRQAFDFGPKAYLLTEALQDPLLMPLRRHMARKAFADKIIGDELLPVEELARCFADAHGIPASSYATAISGVAARPRPQQDRRVLPPMDRLQDNIRYSDAVVFFDTDSDGAIIRETVRQFAKNLERPLLILKQDDDASLAVADFVAFLGETGAGRLYITGSAHHLTKFNRHFVEDVLDRTLTVRLKPMLLGSDFQKHAPTVLVSAA